MKVNVDNLKCDGNYLSLLDLAFTTKTSVRQLPPSGGRRGKKGLQLRPDRPPLAAHLSLVFGNYLPVPNKARGRKAIPTGLIQGSFEGLADPLLG